jgi:hypothetical protein
MPDTDISISSMETGEISDLNSRSDFLSQDSGMDRDRFVLELATAIHGPFVTEARIDALAEQIRRHTRGIGDLDSAVDEVRREFLIRTCRSSIDKRLGLATQIRKEMEAYERAAAKIRNVVSPKYVKAHKKKDINVGDWEKARADMHDAFIPASRSLQELEVNIFVASPGTTLTSTIETL